jgi:hypothetical protein
MRGYFKLLIFLAFSFQINPSPTTDVAPLSQNGRRFLDFLLISKPFATGRGFFTSKFGFPEVHKLTHPATRIRNFPNAP